MVGLGNPGPRYAATRHNLGFRIVERLALRHGIALRDERFSGRFGEGRVGDRSVALLEPQTFMNRSGASVAAAAGRLGIDPQRDLLLVYDDIDLPLGRIRVRPSGGAGGHRGLADVIDQLGSSAFARLRFGVGRPPAHDAWSEYVLDAFSEAEERLLEVRVDIAAEAVEVAVTLGVTAAMNRFNPDPDQGGAA